MLLIKSLRGGWQPCTVVCDNFTSMETVMCYYGTYQYKCVCVANPSISIVSQPGGTSLLDKHRAEY